MYNRYMHVVRKARYSSDGMSICMCICKYICTDICMRSLVTCIRATLHAGSLPARVLFPSLIHSLTRNGKVRFGVKHSFFLQIHVMSTRNKKNREKLRYQTCTLVKSKRAFFICYFIFTLIKIAHNIPNREINN